jgi:uncharacterized membrane protein YidH (DUF202 family)
MDMPTTDQAQRAARELRPDRGGDPEWLHKAARVGFLAKGLVYGLIGVLAVQIALGDSAQADQSGALSAVARQPFGTVVLWLAAVGFAAYALWRFSQAAWGRRDESDERMRTVKRVGSALNGIGYLVLGVLSARTALEGGGSGGGNTGLTARVLEAPGGQVAVVLVGLGVIGLALGLTWRGLTTDFDEHLDRGRMGGRTYDAVRRLGQVGYPARGLVFFIAGVFVVKAALEHEPGQAKGLDLALQQVAEAPFGQVLLVVVALGLICFGAFCVAEARYRRL